MKPREVSQTEGMRETTAHPRWHSHGGDDKGAIEFREQIWHWLIGEHCSPGGRPTVALWRGTAAPHCFGARVQVDQCEWASRARGQEKMTTRCCMGQLRRSHATDIHQSGDDTVSHTLNKHGPLVGRCNAETWARNRGKVARTHKNNKLLVAFHCKIQHLRPGGNHQEAFVTKVQSKGKCSGTFGSSLSAD